MFDLAWSEIAIIAAVAVVVIGPKDLPIAIRTVTSFIKKARQMASEFQSHVDEMVKEANLDDVRNQISELKNFDIKREIEKAVDPDHSIRDTFATDPLTPASADVPAADGTEPAAVTEATVPPEPVKPDTPAFIPPSYAPPVVAAAAADPDEPPPFIPPVFAATRPAQRA